MKPPRALLLALAVLCSSAALAGTAHATTITELPPLAAGSGPEGIAAGPDGNVWFVENRASRFGRVVPSTGKITDFSTGSGISANSLPAEITPGPDGGLWFTEEAPSRIGRIDPRTATAKEFAASGQPEGITTGPDGNLWFTEFAGNRIGRITPAGAITEFSQGIGPASMPLGIAAGPDGNLWFTELRFESNPIGRITLPGAVTEFSAGISAASQPARIVAGPDGNLWFSEQTGDAIGRITPAGVVTEFRTGLSRGSGPVGIAVGPDGNLWFAEFGGTSGSHIGRITPAGVVTEFPKELSASPLDITLGPDGNLWFTEPFGNRIGEVRLDPEVTTGGASSIGSAGATLAGTVNTVGTDTSYVVQYGTSTNYGATTASKMLSAGGKPVAIAANVGGLKPGTLYHYRVVAANARGTTNGADATFTTARGSSTGGGGTPRDTSAPKLAIATPAKPAAPGKGSLTLQIGCPLAETLGCHGSVRLETLAKVTASRKGAAPSRLALGTVRFRVGAGQKRAVEIRLSRSGKAFVRKHHRLRVRAIVTAVDAAGNHRTTVKRLTLTSRGLR